MRAARVCHIRMLGQREPLLAATGMVPMTLPILYTFRRCPYAIRARMGLAYAGVRFELREVVLSNKPQAMLSASPKATVPVLVLTDGTVIDESREILAWSLSQSDPDGWLSHFPAEGPVAESLIDQCDGEFKTALDKYKYHVRFPESSQHDYRQQAEEFLARLDAMLAANRFLFGDRVSYADVAVFPFVRQFSRVDLAWFLASKYEALAAWLGAWEASDRYRVVMNKYAPWSGIGAGITFHECREV